MTGGWALNPRAGCSIHCARDEHTNHLLQRSTMLIGTTAEGTYLSLVDGDPVCRWEPLVVLDVVHAVLEVAVPLRQVDLQQILQQVLQVRTEVGGEPHLRAQQWHEWVVRTVREITYGKATQDIQQLIPATTISTGPQTSEMPGALTRIRIRTKSTSPTMEGLATGQFNVPTMWNRFCTPKPSLCREWRLMKVGRGGVLTFPETIFS